MRNKSVRFRRLAWAAVILVVIVAMGFGTRVVSGSALAATVPVEFNAQAFGAKHFPIVKADIIKDAKPLAEVATALSADQAAAAKTYGVHEGTSFPVFSVTFTAVVEDVDAAGFLHFTIPGVPSQTNIRVQTGPAIGGTDLRDASGTIHFPDFLNQIQYQDAGVALNDELKKQVLANVKAADLKGKTVTITGAFQLVNPAAYLITPVKIVVN